MKKQFEHLINSRVLTTFHSINDELKLDKKKNYLFDLTYLDIIELNGDKSLDFLQGQLTCDVNAVSDIQIAQGAQCNLKGRILALVDIINWQGFKLLVPKDLVESTKNSLNKTAQLSRISLSENRDLQIFGLLLQNPTDLLPDSLFIPNNLYAKAYNEDYCYYHLGMGYYIFVVKKHCVDKFTQQFSQSDQLLGSLTWHTLRLFQKQIEIYPESRGLFLPHRLDLHQTQYLNFDKGCYKGQEIIARTHYRATLKHELKIFTVQTNERIFSGQKLIRSNESSELGELVDYSYINENTYLIAASVLKEPIDQALFEGHSEPIILTATHDELN